VHHPPQARLANSSQNSSLDANPYDEPPKRLIHIQRSKTPTQQTTGNKQKTISMTENCLPKSTIDKEELLNKSAKKLLRIIKSPLSTKSQLYGDRSFSHERANRNLD